MTSKEPSEKKKEIRKLGKDYIYAIWISAVDYVYIPSFGAETCETCEVQLVGGKLWRREAYDGNSVPPEWLFDVLVTEKQNKRAHHLHHIYAKFLPKILCYMGAVSFPSLIDGLSIQTLDSPWKIEQLRPRRLDYSL
jgi:hypothetical protein